MKKIVAAALAIVLLFTLMGCAKRTVVFDMGDASKLKIFSGSTGLSATVTDAGIIERVSDNINALSFDKDKSSKNYDGFGYSLTWYDENGGVIESVIVQGKDRISYDGYFYDETTEGEIDTEYIDDVLAQFQKI